MKRLSDKAFAKALRELDPEFVRQELEPLLVRGSVTEKQVGDFFTKGVVPLHWRLFFRLPLPPIEERLERARRMASVILSIPRRRIRITIE